MPCLRLYPIFILQICILLLTKPEIPSGQHLLYDGGIGVNSVLRQRYVLPLRGQTILGIYYLSSSVRGFLRLQDIGKPCAERSLLHVDVAVEVWDD
jgi:hypothetical protein